MRDGVLAMTIDFLDSADPAAELLHLRARCYQLLQLAEATDRVLAEERARHCATRDLLAVALRRGDGAQAARLERMEVVMRGVLAFHNKHEQAAWDKQQAWMAFEAALVEVEK